MRKVSETPEKYTDEEIRIGDYLLNREDVTKEIDTPRGTFTIRIPSAGMRRLIISSTAKSLGAPLDHVPAEDYLFVAALCTLDRVLVGWPDWWKGAAQCHDEELIGTIFAAFREFDEAFRRRLRGDGPGASGEVEVAGGVGDKQVPRAADGSPLPGADGGADAAPIRDGGEPT